MKKKIPILFMDQSIQSGGGGRSLFYILKFIDRERFEPIVLLPNENGVLTNRINEENICKMISEPCLHSSNKSIRFCGKNYSEASALERILSLVRNYGELVYLGFVKLNRIIINHKIDAIYSNNDTTRILSLIAGLLTCTPVVWHVRNVSKSRFWSLLTRFSAIKKVIFISNAQQKLFRVPAEKSAVVYNGIDIDEFKQNCIQKKLREEYQISKKAVIFGVTGRILPKKGYLSFLRAGKMTMDLCKNEEIILAVIGGAFNELQEKYLMQLKNLASELNISDKVIFTGFKTDIKSYVSDLDVLVVPSVWDEPFGRTALEGMALGIPVLASRIGGLPEVIEENMTGLLYESGNTEGLSHCMKQMVQERQTGSIMGQKGRERCEKEFCIALRTKEIDHILESLIVHKSK
ncbi:glycosyltransferase family 4 protein [bacterium]|nr:glycosyltransferase family 4 protein [bacterium]